MKAAHLQDDVDVVQQELNLPVPTVTVVQFDPFKWVSQRPGGDLRLMAISEDLRRLDPTLEGHVKMKKLPRTTSALRRMSLSNLFG